MLIQGYVIRETEKALAVVLLAEAHVSGVRPLWIPRSQITDWSDLENGKEARISTASDGVRKGNPFNIEITDSFAEKIWLLASA
jgi:hypothetical protein